MIRGRWPSYYFYETDMYRKRYYFRTYEAGIAEHKNLHGRTHGVHKTISLRNTYNKFHKNSSQTHAP